MNSPVAEVRNSSAGSFPQKRTRITYSYPDPTRARQNVLVLANEAADAQPPLSFVIVLVVVFVIVVVFKLDTGTDSHTANQNHDREGVA
jgi:hypothetical protein